MVAPMTRTPNSERIAQSRVLSRGVRRQSAVLSWSRERGNGRGGRLKRVREGGIGKPQVGSHSGYGANV